MHVTTQARGKRALSHFYLIVHLQLKRPLLIKVAISEQTFAHSTVLDSSLSFHKFDFCFIACSSSKKSHVVNDRLPRHRYRLQTYYSMSTLAKHVSDNLL